jgi:hypothetical protein
MAGLVGEVSEVSENRMRIISFPVCFKSRRSEEIEDWGTHPKTTDFTDLTDCPSDPSFVKSLVKHFWHRGRTLPD